MTVPARRTIGAVGAVAALALLVAGPAPTASADTHEAVPAAAEPFEIGIRAVEAVYRPLHAAFAGAAADLDGAVRAFCETSDDARLDAARRAFAEAVPAFGAIEPLRVGPLLEDNRINRAFFWPDSRRAGERQLRALVADEAPLDAAGIAGKSVALQGLPALERLLHGDVIAADPARACRVAVPVAANVRGIADALEAAWDAPEGIARAMVDTPADDPLFRSRTEVLRSLATQLRAGLESLAGPKLLPVVEADARSMRTLPFARSGRYAAFLGGNVDALAALLLDAGLADAAGVAAEAKFELGNVRRLLAKLDGELVDPTLRTLPPDAAADTARALRAGTLAIERLLLDRVAPALGTGTGFNSADGD